MPTSLATALVIVLALVPGALGSYVFVAINGADWRRNQWDAGIRYVAFSALGLAVYSMVGKFAGWPLAEHVIPASYATVSLSAASLPSLAIPYLGHLSLSGAVGLLAALGARFVAVLSRNTVLPCAWDAFVRGDVAERWVVVTLLSGDVWAGYVGTADFGVQAAERDLVLREPALYNSEHGSYEATPYYSVYFPASLVQNVAAVSNPNDSRIGPGSGNPLFSPEGKIE